VSLADAVAVLRAIAVIPIVWAIAADQRGVALAIFLVAAASDSVDGWLARRAGHLGARGAFLDPLADKILVLGTLVALAIAGAGWPVTVVAVLIFARELVVVIARAKALMRDVTVSADRVAKAKTVLEMAGVALVIFGGRPWSVLGAGVLGLAFLVGILTLPRYFKRRLA
jgi:CDP-diacylglycerol--glycerol-3-phosphate 3-phosphatidyltransferase